jgi:hypothetical protein
MARRTTKQEAASTAPVVKETKDRKIPQDTMIAVVNNRTNELVYGSVRMAGVKYMWESFGETQYIEFAELVSMRGSAPRFFSENWIVVEPSEGYSTDEIYKALGVDRYYKHVVTPKTLDALFTKPLDYIKGEMEHYSESIKKLVYERAVQLRETGELDSISKFNAVKELAGVKDIIEG